MSESLQTVVLTALLGGAVLMLLLAPLRSRVRSLSVAALDANEDVLPPIDAMSEIAFDRAIGKLSDADAAFLTARYSPTSESVSDVPAIPSTPAAPLPAGGGFCHQCGTALMAGARFCHVCGTTTAAASGAASTAAATVQPRKTLPPELAATDPAPRGGSIVPWAIAFIALLAIVGALMGRDSTESTSAVAAAPPATGGAPNAPFANGATGPAPDISNMTPTERAQRLFDRIRTAAQAGDSARVNTFLPMALAAYDMIPPGEKTADDRFSQATLAELAGAPELVRAQADTILSSRSTNLLGLILRVRHALMTGNDAALTAARAALLAAQPAEMASPRPEYAKFQGAIAQAVDEARPAAPKK
jgi:hypothetical protein